MRSPAAAYAEEVAVTKEVISLSGGTAVGFSEDWTSAIEIPVPSSLNIALDGLGNEIQGARVDVFWNSLLAKVNSDTAVIAMADRGYSVAISSSEDDGITHLSFMIPDDFAPEVANMVTCVLPVELALEYPNEVLPDEAMPYAVLALPDGRNFQTATAAVDSTTGLAWGAEISVLWANQELAGENGLKYSQPTVPISIRVKSVGPTAIPAGSSVSIRLSPNIDYRFMIASSYLGNDEATPFPVEISKEEHGALDSWVLTLEQEISAEDSLRVNFSELSFDEVSSLAEQLSSCSVSMLQPTGQESRLVRDTGMTSQSWAR